MTTPDEYNADDFLMGGGIPSGHAVFDGAPHGTSLTGTVTVKPITEQQKDLDTGKLKFWESDGKPMMQLVITLQTELNDPNKHGDVGLRKLYVKGNMLNAIRTAVRAAGQAGLGIGGTLTITYTGDGEQKKPGKNPAKVYSAAYIPPAEAAVNAILAEPKQPTVAATGAGWTPPSDMPTWEAAALAAMPDGQRNALLALAPDQRKQFLPSA